MNNNWDVTKKNHLALSDEYADKYDENYEKSNFATGSYMRYELQTIERFINEAPSKYLAVDLGCGTGRDSFFLSKYFEQVFAYDFSPKMIRNAIRNKFAKGIGNVLFDIKDIEEGLVEFEQDSVPFVNTAFGMGSFVNNIEKLSSELERILMPQGIAIFSFYNSDALVNNLQLEWSPAISARLDAGNNTLNVEIDGKIHSIGARSYNVREIRKKLEGYFQILEITTFPTLSALFPSKLFENQIARDLCTNVDQILSNNLDIAAGPYIIVICKKKGSHQKERQLKGYEKFLYLIRNHKIKLLIKEHEPALKMEDIFNILGDIPHDEMLVSILITVEESSNINSAIHGGKHFLIGLPADRKLDYGKLATFLGVKRQNIKQTEPGSAEHLTGFTPGSIPPFAMPKKIPVIIDTRLTQKKAIWCGTGKATESIKITIEDLKLMSTFTDADISKPKDKK